MRLPLLYISLLFLACCSTTDKRHKEYNDIKIGMVKSEVLDVAGPPYWSDRSNGLDRWIYYMKPEDKQTEKIVYFREGKVFQKGFREKPTLTAEELEEIKKPRLKVKAHKPRLSDDQLRKVIKKEIKKTSKEKPPKFEQI